MDPRERHTRIAELFAHAAAIPEAERAAFLNDRCDPEMAGEVLRLLCLDAEAADWLEPVQPSLQSDDRYDVREEIGHGGMGVVHRVWDRQLERELAMKLLREGHSSRPQSSPSRQLRRFLDEARITAQLDHPGILPVHDLLVDADGRARFTMKLVEGEDLRAVFVKIRERRDGWTLTRALVVLERVCEAMAYAHAKGVIHRDLKPSNVMVGGFGAVYVMDWGLARELERDAPYTGDDATHAAGPGASTTIDGEVLGTPAYMPPEQAAGNRDAMGPQSDVYSVGAMLYELLSGDPPYLEDGAAQSSRKVWDRVRSGPPTPIEERAPQTAPELAAVCAKAMARDPTNRYRDMGEMATDLAAFVEGRVVRAYRTGAWTELHKWTSRNRAAAVAIGVAITALAVGLVVAVGQMRRAESHARSIAALSAGWRLEELHRRAERLWPPHPALIPALRRWIDDAASAVAAIDARFIANPSDRPRPLTTGDVALQHAWADRSDREQAEIEARIGELSAALAKDDVGDNTYRRRISEALARLEEARARGESEQGRHESMALGALDPNLPRGDLDDLRRSACAFLDADSGPWRGLVPGQGPGVARRLAIARRVAEEGARASSDWEELRVKVKADPLYHGLDLAPQVGLVPLSVDPESGLWEFWHTPSGEPPARDADGRLVVTDETGLVFVLLPPASFLLGAQYDDPAGTNYRDPAAFPDDATLRAYMGMEAPVQRVELAAFFLSKFEVTQSQWLRLAGTASSFYTANAWPLEVSGRTHPADRVNWFEAVETLERYALTLPTEAQWEYACVADTDRSYFFGGSSEGIERYANIRDVEFLRFVERPVRVHDASDGFAVHAPVGSKLPNPFGLHDMLGNVAEWCRDRFCEYENPFGTLQPGDALRLGSVNDGRIWRGGGFDALPFDVRATARSVADPRFLGLGVRPARVVEPNLSQPAGVQRER